MQTPSVHPHELIRCAEDPELPRLALCATDLDDFDDPPEWVELIPAGDPLEALDGRRFRNTSPQDVVAAFNADPRDLPIDWEHSSEHKARNGDPAPAAGWITALEVRGGAVWGRVKWTARGLASLRSKEYRYISPVFSYDAKGKRLVRMHSAGLTNQPAFHLQVMAAQYTTAEISAQLQTADAPPSTTEAPTMDPKLLALLGLAEGATADDVYNAVSQKISESADTAAKLGEVKTELEAAQAKHVDLGKFVPRSEYDKQVERAQAAETQIAEAEKAQHDAAVTAAIDAAIEAGKVVPANRDFYVAACSTAEGFESFKKFAEGAPVIAQDSDLDSKKPKDGTGAPAVSDEERAIFTKCGLTEEQYLGRDTTNDNANADA